MRALLTNLRNLYRGGNDPEPKLPWRWTDFVTLAVVGAVVFLIVYYLIP